MNKYINRKGDSGMAGRQLANKWVKTTVLLSDPKIAGHIPQTKLYNSSNLHSMVSTYGMVVIKPLVGGGGYGVIKVTKEGGTYSYTSSSKRRTFSSFDDLYSSLSRVKKKRQYMIQRGIHLATVGGQPIDYRVKVVKVKDYWEFRSMVGRVAKKGLFVTNLCKGGTQLTARQGIERSFSRSKVRSKKSEMRKLTIAGTAVLERKFPGIGELGFDYGIDRKGKIWIFEVNTRPQ